MRACDSVSAWEISGPSGSNPPATLNWLLRGARKVLTSRPPDLLHCPSFVAPWGVPIPFVVTVHDAGGRRFPGDHPLEWRIYDRALLGRRLRAAARVITGSNFGRKDVIDAYRLKDDRVVVIPYGIDSRYFEPVTTASGAGPAVMLFPGAPVPRKNIDAVLSCMAAADTGSALGASRLDISGARAADFPEVVARIASAHLATRVRWLGHLPADDLPSVVARSSVVVYPSLSEGFGFPVLEALAVGTPVVCSNRGSLPEVAGDAALLVDPSDPRALADALDAVLTRPEVRQRLRDSGRKRAREFTWKKCAQSTCEVYRTVVSETNARP